MTETFRTPDPGASNRRAYYRIDYPVMERPGFRSAVVEGAVRDCSETGVRVAVSKPLPKELALQPGDRLAGEVRFHDDEVQAVEGEVVTFDGRTLILRLDAETIPFGRIIREQRWLRKRYPMREGR